MFYIFLEDIMIYEKLIEKINEIEIILLRLT